jgi:hypothetical protein
LQILLVVASACDYGDLAMSKKSIKKNIIVSNEQNSTLRVCEVAFLGTDPGDSDRVQILVSDIDVGSCKTRFDIEPNGEAIPWSAGSSAHVHPRIISDHDCKVIKVIEDQMAHLAKVRRILLHKAWMDGRIVTKSDCLTYDQVKALR